MNANTPLSPKAVGRRYTWEFTVAMSLYVVVMLLTTRLLRTYPHGPWHLGIALLPLIPLILLFVAVMRFMLHTDEMIRRLHVQAFAIAAGVTAFLALTWGFLEMAGLPKLSAWWTFVCVDVVWGISDFVLHRRITGKWLGSC